MALLDRYDSQYEEDDQPAAGREEGVAPRILVAGTVGLALGIILWSSLAMSVVSVVGSIFDELALNTEGVAALPVLAETPSPTATATATATPTATPPPAATPAPDRSVNRQDCNAIRGTAYVSPEERTWYLTNCVRN